MYQLYIKNGLNSKDLIGEYNEMTKAYEKIEKELAKNKDVKYVLEKTTGHVDIYGNLTTTVIDEN